MDSVPRGTCEINQQGCLQQRGRPWGWCHILFFFLKVLLFPLSMDSFLKQMWNTNNKSHLIWGIIPSCMSSFTVLQALVTFPPFQRPQWLDSIKWTVSPLLFFFFFFYLFLWPACYRRKLTPSNCHHVFQIILCRRGQRDKGREGCSGRASEWASERVNERAGTFCNATGRL